MLFKYDEIMLKNELKGKGLREKNSTSNNLTLGIKNISVDVLTLIKFEKITWIMEEQMPLTLNHEQLHTCYVNV
jgi:hypothetical protein